MGYGAWTGRVVTIVLALAVAGAATAQADLDRRLRAAVAKLDQGDALGAMLDLEALLGRDEEYWPAHYHLGRAQVQMGDDLGARRSFQRAAELNPGNPDLHYMIASAAWQLADFEGAWAQGIAAWQAGYDPVTLQQMFDRLAEYAPAPSDLQERLAAPRVVVVDEAVVGDEAAETVAEDIRAELFRAPLMALVRDTAIARFRIDVERDETGRVRLTLRNEADETLAERAVPVGPEGPGPEAMLAIESFIETVAARVAG